MPFLLLTKPYTRTAAFRDRVMGGDGDGDGDRDGGIGDGEVEMAGLNEPAKMLEQYVLF